MHSQVHLMVFQQSFIFHNPEGTQLTKTLYLKMQSVFNNQKHGEKQPVVWLMLEKIRKCLSCTSARVLYTSQENSALSRI